MIKGGVENGQPVGGAAFYPDSAEVFLPGGFRRGAYAVEAEPLLLGIQVLAGIGRTHKRHAHLYQDFFPGREAVVVEPEADIVSAQFPGIGLVQLVVAFIGVPCGFCAHRPLLFPVAAAGRKLAHPEHEIDGKHRLVVVAEPAHELGALDFRLGDFPEGGSALVGQAFAQVQEDVPFAAGERVSLQGGPGGGGHLGPDAVEELDAIIAGMRLFLREFTAVEVVVGLDGTGSGHGQERPQLRAAHAGEVHMREACEIAVLGGVRGAPPAAVLVIDIQAGAHDVEGRHAHHSVGCNGPRVAGAVIGRADERIHVGGNPLGVQERS